MATSIELGQPEGVVPDGAQPVVPDADPVRLVIPIDGGTIPLKTSSAILYLQFDWSSALSQGVTLSSVVHTVPGVLVNEGEDNDDSTSDLNVSGGVHARLYALTITATLSSGQTLSRSWPLRVYDAG